MKYLWNPIGCFQKAHLLFPLEKLLIEQTYRQIVIVIQITHVSYLKIHFDCQFNKTKKQGEGEGGKLNNAEIDVAGRVCQEGDCKDQFSKDILIMAAPLQAY